MMDWLLQHPYVIAVIACGGLFLLAINRQLANTFITLLMLGCLLGCAAAVVAIWSWDVTELQKITDTLIVCIAAIVFAVILVGNVQALTQAGSSAMTGEMAQRSNGCTAVVMLFGFGAMAIVWILSPGMDWAVLPGWASAGAALAGLIVALVVIGGLLRGGAR